jgi:hypothetical protein
LSIYLIFFFAMLVASNSKFFQTPIIIRPRC